MVLVHDAPFAIDFPEPHCEPEFKGFPPARAIHVDAFSLGSRKCNIRPGCDLNILNAERNRLLNTGEEKPLGRHVGIQSAR